MNAELSTRVLEFLGFLPSILPGIPFVVFYVVIRGGSRVPDRIARWLMGFTVLSLILTIVFDVVRLGRPDLLSLWVFLLTAATAIGYHANLKRG